MNKNKDLLPCPFCGGEADIVGDWKTNYSDYYQVFCENCGVSQTGQDYEAEQEAIEAWNRRTCSCKKQEG